MARRIITETEIQTIKEAVEKYPLSMADAARFAGIAYRTFIYRAQKIGVYKPNRNHKGRTFENGGKKSFPLQDILKGKHPTYRTAALKKRMIRSNLLENICAECGIGDTWNDKSIVLELDHINGNSTDHKKRNLRLLCPNCHSQTSTFRGRKNKKPR